MVEPVIYVMKLRSDNDDHSQDKSSKIEDPTVETQKRKTIRTTKERL